MTDFAISERSKWRVASAPAEKFSPRGSRSATALEAMAKIVCLVAAGALVACHPIPGSDSDPSSPAFQKAASTYEMGCRPSDFQGYEHMSLYCGNDK